MPFLVPFVLLPVLEVAVFLLVCLAVGFWSALGLLVAGSAFGAVVLRVQGAATRRLMSGGFRAEDPGAALEGVWRALAGVLLVVPGFVTDALALVLLVKPVRRTLVVLLIGAAARAVGRGGPAPQAERSAAPSPMAPMPSGPVIDVEFEDLPPPPVGRRERP